jgi:diguanylate cyclase (GGDEF)-like protein
MPLGRQHTACELARVACPPQLNPQKGIAMDTPPLRILLVEDDPHLLNSLSQQLRAQGHEVLQAASAQQGWQQYLAQAPQLILLDVMLPDDNGHWLAHQVRRHEGRHWTPILFLSALAQERDLLEGIEAGGDDYLFKPVSPAVLLAKLHATHRQIALRDALSQATADLSQANDKLLHLSRHDELTQLGNRRGFDERLVQYIGQARRDQRPLTVMLCDVDFFKRFNDRLGHVEGDRCLRHIGQILSNVCRRPLDYAARYGGEEFVLLLPNTPAEGALIFAMALQHALDRDSLYHPDSAVATHVTVSGGFVSLIPDGQTSAESLLQQADEALYEAKARGRYRFVNLAACMDTDEQTRPVQRIRPRGADAPWPSPLRVAAS